MFCGEIFVFFMHGIAIAKLLHWNNCVTQVLVSVSVIPQNFPRYKNTQGIRECFPRRTFPI